MNATFTAVLIVGNVLLKFIVSKEIYPNTAPFITYQIGHYIAISTNRLIMCKTVMAFISYLHILPAQWMNEHKAHRLVYFCIIGHKAIG